MIKPSNNEIWYNADTDMLYIIIGALPHKDTFVMTCFSGMFNIIGIYLQTDAWSYVGEL